MRTHRRNVARALLVDDQGAILFQRQPWRGESGRHRELWLPPGGEVERGETLGDAVRRELVEETGFDGTVQGLPIAVRRKRYEHELRFHDAVAYYFVVPSPRFAVDLERLAVNERAALLESAWLTADARCASEIPIVPPELDQILAARRPLTSVGDWDERRLFLSVGHSNRSIETFTGLLRALGVECVADVRTTPWSRRMPWFRAEALHAALAARSIGYHHVPQVGGLRPEVERSPKWAGLDAAWWGYASHMGSDDFSDGLADLEALARSHRLVALMCAEMDHTRCHRNLLADALEHRGHAVLHVGDTASELRPHFPHPAYLSSGPEFSYPARQTGLFDD